MRYTIYPRDSSQHHASDNFLPGRYQGPVEHPFQAVDPKEEGVTSFEFTDAYGITEHSYLPGLHQSYPRWQGRLSRCEEPPWQETSPLGR